MWAFYQCTARYQYLQGVGVNCLVLRVFVWGDFNDFTPVTRVVTRDQSKCD